MRNRDTSLDGDTSWAKTQARQIHAPNPFCVIGHSERRRKSNNIESSKRNLVYKKEEVET